MTEDPNRPLTPPADSRGAPASDRPAPGPHSPGDPGSRFPQDETWQGRAPERAPEPGPDFERGGAPQAVDPGLADQPAERPPQPGATSGGMGAGGPGLADGGSPAPGSLEQPPLDRFRERWASVQGAFVDDPKAAVVEADRLVTEVIYDLEQKLTRRREHLQSQWRDGEPDTEQLRRHLHGYRALFHRIVESGF